MLAFLADGEVNGQSRSSCGRWCVVNLLAAEKKRVTNKNDKETT